jgi:hypothetical protein
MRVYLSSTLNDLRPERQAVKDSLSSLHTVVESYDADEQSVRDSCLADVATCQLYVGIVGLRYGFIPPGETKSITELEFDAAGEQRIERLVFVKAVEATPASFTDSRTRECDPARIEEFRTRVTSGAAGLPRPAFFSTCDELTKRLLRALLRQQPLHADEDAGRSEQSRLPVARPSPTPEALTSEARGDSDFQRMLWRHLHGHWEQIDAHPRFRGAEVIRRCRKPLTAREVFDAVIAADCEDVLEELRTSFEPTAAPFDRSSPAYGALELIALVAAERFVLAEQERLGVLPGTPHEPVPGQDPLLAAVVAAAIFRFGLRFSAGNRLPENVLYATAPQSELGNPGEEGASLFRKELVAMANRIDLGSEHDTAGMEDVSDRRLTRLLAKIAGKLDCPVAVAATAGGALSASESRESLVQDLKRIGVRAFFTPVALDEPPPSVRTLLSDLKLLLAPFFFPGSPSRPPEIPMSKTDSPAPNAGAVTHPARAGTS